MPSNDSEIPKIMNVVNNPAVVNKTQTNTPSQLPVSRAVDPKILQQSGPETLSGAWATTDHSYQQVLLGNGYCLRGPGVQHSFSVTQTTDYGTFSLDALAENSSKTTPEEIN